MVPRNSQRLGAMNCQLYRNHRTSSGRVARFPYIRIPTRYSFAEIHSTTKMLPISRPIDTTNCHIGGIWDAIRRNMMIGAVGGNSDAATAQIEFESLITTMISEKLSHTGTAASGMYICSSCSVSHVAANPANKELYRR